MQSIVVVQTNKRREEILHGEGVLTQQCFLKCCYLWLRNSVAIQLIDRCRSC